MKQKGLIYTVLLLMVGFAYESNAQVYTRYVVVSGDTVPIFDLPIVTVGTGSLAKAPTFKNKREQQKYTRLVRYVKKVYPYAKLASQKLNECEASIQNDPNSRKKAMRNAERALRKRYGSAMKKLTVTQGKLLLLLIDRETGFTTFELVKELRGGFNASMYQGLAVLFGHNLKMNYDAKGEHWMIEDIVKRVEKGLI